MLNESVEKLHDSEKSMILDPVARIGETYPNCFDGGLPSRAGEAAEDTRRSSGPSQCEAGERSEPARRARSQQDPKGRFFASKSFATDSHLLEQLIEAQQKKLLASARRIVPHVTADDLLQPNDFPELEFHPHFRYEEGILDGLKVALTALRAKARDLKDGMASRS